MYYFQHDPIRLQVSQELVGTNSLDLLPQIGTKTETAAHVTTTEENPFTLFILSFDMNF